MYAKLTVAGNLEETRKAIAKWLWMCDFTVQHEEECSGYAPVSRVTLEIPDGCAKEAGMAIAQWVKAQREWTSLRGALLSVAGLPWPDD